MTSALKEFEARVARTTGPDKELDRAVFQVLAGSTDANEAPGYTSSVDECIRLIGAVLPDWHWHVGHGPRGILPYASLSKAKNPDHRELRVEASAPTVPLALLHAAAKALIAGEGSESDAD